ncbi:hypothetical protein PENSPDRAFT_688971 [Peniophora sp. CONT]|nr:hypothetical protein PENSPDRAFT_688971 [Peniophora sp. CONT]
MSLPIPDRRTQHLPIEERLMWEGNNREALWEAMDNGICRIPLLERLDTYSSPHTAMRELVFIQNGTRTVLCQRLPDGNGLEAGLIVTGVVSSANVMPFTRNEQTRLQTLWSAPGTQSIALVGYDHTTFGLATEAITNIRTMARAHCIDGFREEPCDILMHEQTAIVAQTPLATPRRLVKPDSTRVPHNPLRDPYNIVSDWCALGECVVLEENHVEMYQALETDVEGRFKYSFLSGDTIRYGQVVRLELGFQIVPCDGWFKLNIDLRSITLIDSRVTDHLPLPNLRSRPENFPVATGAARTVTKKPRNAYILAANERNLREQGRSNMADHVDHKADDRRHGVGISQERKRDIRDAILFAALNRRS